MVSPVVGARFPSIRATANADPVTTAAAKSESEVTGDRYAGFLGQQRDEMCRPDDANFR